MGRIAEVLAVLLVVEAMGAGFDEMRDMLLDHGGRVHANLTIARSRYGGNGLFCRGTIEAADVVLQVPSSVILHPHEAVRLYPQLAWLPLTGAEAIAACLGMERFHGRSKRARRTLVRWLLGDDSPRWEAWIDALPRTTVPNAASWSDADVQLAYELFETAELPLMRTARAIDPPLELTAAQWRWALSMALSRSFDGDVILPLVDFANHQPIEAGGPNLAAVRTASTLERAIADGRVLFALSRPCRDEEIFLDYGQRSALRMEAAFGTAMEASSLGWRLPGNGTDGELCRRRWQQLQHRSAGFSETLRRVKRLLRRCASNVK